MRTTRGTSGGGGLSSDVFVELDSTRSGGGAQPRTQRIDSLFPAAKKSSVRGAKEPAAKTPAAAAEPKAKSAAPKAAPKKGSGKGVGTTKGRKKPAPEFYQEWESQGRTWAVGDDAYLVETDDHMQLPLEDHDDLCCVCEKGNKRNSMIECARCLGGFHMGCLKPKLKAVPEGDWLCPGCVAGCALPNRKLRTAADQFLWGDHVLGLAYIDGIVANRSGDGRVEVACRYYLTPEQTHAGRQEHNTTREVYLTTQVHYEPIESLFWPAVVCKPSEADDHEGNDVFSCEYMYDEAYKRFVRRVYKGHGGGDDAGAAASDSDASDADWDAGLASGSGSEGDDAEFDVVAEGGARASGGGAGKGGKGSKGGRVAKPIYQFWAERGMLTGGLPKKLRGGIDAVLASTGGAGKQRSAVNRAARAPASAAGAGASASSSSSPAASGGASGSDAVDALTGALLSAGAVGSSTLPCGRVSEFASARRALSTASPKSLPCRDAEKARVTRFIEDAVGVGAAAARGGSAGASSSSAAGSAGVMYICGIPGTGKTACVMEVLSGLRARAVAAGVQVVVINALSLPSPQHVYSKLWERMSGARCGPAKALSQLQAALVTGDSGVGGAKKPGMTLLLVDEIDVLMTKDQSVLYNLFEWPTMQGARLSVIGISNTHDLDSRVLPRIASRLASSKLAFQPYSADQLRTIANARLQGCSLFAPPAVEYCVRKVASTSGDVRRVLELLRRSLDAAEEGLAAEVAAGRQLPDSLAGAVASSHAIQAVKDTYASVHMQFLRSCSLGEKLLMVALMMEMRATKKAAAAVQALHTRLDTHLAMLMPEARMPESAIVSLAAGLAAKGLATVSPTWHHVRARVQFKVDVADVAAALKDDARLVPVHGQMSS